LGGHLENAQDMAIKGRSMRGSNHVWSKLTEEDVKFMRHLYWAERKSLRELGAYFGVNPIHVNRIVTRKQWAWLS
jgi:hypothetical protein